MKILVTGGNGFIGTHLVRVLVAAGHEVVSLDDLSVGKETNEVRKAAYLYEDIERISYFDGTEVDIVFHLAALSRIQPSFKYPSEYFRVLTKGTEIVADWATTYNVKVIYASSSSVHQNYLLSPYSTYKFLGESILQMYKTVYNLDAHVARLYNVYGPLEEGQGEFSTLLGKWRQCVTNNEPITIVGDGEQTRDFTFVDDIVDGLIKISKYQGKENNIWELGTGFTYSINEVASMFKTKYNCEAVYVPDQPGNYRESYRKDDKALELLDWYPKNRLPDYIKSL